MKGRYGFKRFLRDGYGSVLEDKSRRYYYEGETKVTMSFFFLLDKEKQLSSWKDFYFKSSGDDVSLSHLQVKELNYKITNLQRSNEKVMNYRIELNSRQKLFPYRLKQF